MDLDPCSPLKRWQMYVVKVSYGLSKVSYGLGKVPYGLGKVLYGLEVV